MQQVFFAGVPPPQKKVKHRPNSIFGTFNDDILAFKDPQFRRIDMCSAIMASAWSG